MVIPRPALVRPRVLSSVTGQTLLLEEEVEALFSERNRGIIRIVGGPGCGKTTALEHLAHVFGGVNIHFIDDHKSPDPLALPLAGWSVYTASHGGERPLATANYRLALWGQDEWIEYLLHAHRDRCASVMARLRQTGRGDPLEGNPHLWRSALDAMASDESIVSPVTAIVECVKQQLPSPDGWTLAQKTALGLLLVGPSVGQTTSEVWKKQGWESGLKLLRHRPIQLFLAAVQICGDLQNGAHCQYVNHRFPLDLIQQAAAELKQHPQALDALGKWLSGSSKHGTAVSMLHAADCGWTPPHNAKLNLAGAHLSGISWPGIELADVDLGDADLSHADFRKANLDRANAVKADLRHANLRGASLAEFVATEANLAHAELAGCKAVGSLFGGANLEHADLQGADLRECSFVGANLTGAWFKGADLCKSSFLEAELKVADFSRANLASAVLSGLVLRETIFAGARFTGARFVRCDMEGMILPGVDFRNADLDQTLLTGSSMPGANFDGARLTGAGLADIDWEGASLRNADLRGASFHLGSSRSGRVGSPIACEGSRTGFYTDDYTEQDFKAPEEIRKANLCYADLRDAQIEDVDFYLVDLRHAKFDAKCERHLRRCGAILEDRCG